MMERQVRRGRDSRHGMAAVVRRLGWKRQASGQEKDGHEAGKEAKPMEPIR
jgi:hypothetical protein